MGSCVADAVEAVLPVAGFPDHVDSLGLKHRPQQMAVAGSSVAMDTRQGIGIDDRFGALPTEL